jgi:hypothetical protein
MASRGAFRAALALTLAAGLLAAPGPAAGGDAKQTAHRSAPPAEDHGPRPVEKRGQPDPDREIVEHLDEIEDLELLENLELFDPAPQEEGHR